MVDKSKSLLFLTCGISERQPTASPRPAIVTVCDGCGAQGGRAVRAAYGGDPQLGARWASPVRDPANIALPIVHEQHNPLMVHKSTLTGFSALLSFKSGGRYKLENSMFGENDDRTIPQPVSPARPADASLPSLQATVTDHGSLSRPRHFCRIMRRRSRSRSRPTTTGSRSSGTSRRRPSGPGMSTNLEPLIYNPARKCVGWTSVRSER